MRVEEIDSAFVEAYYNPNPVWDDADTLFQWNLMRLGLNLDLKEAKQLANDIAKRGIVVVHGKGIKA